MLARKYAGWEVLIIKVYKANFITLTEVHSMLQRMNELAVQASNGTMSEDDRQNVQDEVDQLISEIDRVSEATKFNETYLLKGDEDKGKVTNTVFKKIDMSLLKDAMSSKSTFTAGTMDNTGKATYTYTSGIAAGDTWNGKEVVATNAGANQITLDDAKSKEKEAMQAVFTTYASEMGIKGTVQVPDSGGTVDITADSNTFEYNKSVSLSLHVGADSESTNKITLNVDSMSSDSLGLTGLKVSGKTALQATGAIDTIADAVSKVSKQRSALGAVQNRLEHTISNLDNVAENTTSAESRIRDTDMAKEMVEYSKNNILMQAGQSMLAQANQSNQGVLSLLQ